MIRGKINFATVKTFYLQFFISKHVAVVTEGASWLVVDKTMKMEHSGTFRNIPEHRIIMVIMRKVYNIKFSVTVKTSNLEAQR